METIIIIGKQSSGKRTLANHLFYSLGYTIVSESLNSEGADLFALANRYEYSEEEISQYNDDMEVYETVKSVQKTLSGEYGFSKAQFSDGKYVICASPSQLSDIFEYLGRDNCTVIYIKIFNSLERRHRAIGEGDFRDNVFYWRDEDEYDDFENVEFDFKLDNKDKDTSKVITQIDKFLKS